MTYDFDFDFLDLKAQDDGPHETEDEPRIAVDDIFGADALQTHLVTNLQHQRLVHQFINLTKYSLLLIRLITASKYNH